MFLLAEHPGVRPTPCAPPGLYIGDERWYETMTCDQHFYKESEQNIHSRRMKRELRERILGMRHRPASGPAWSRVGKIIAASETRVGPARTLQNHVQTNPKPPGENHHAGTNVAGTGKCCEAKCFDTENSDCWAQAIAVMGVDNPMNTPKKVTRIKDCISRGLGEQVAIPKQPAPKEEVITVSTVQWKAHALTLFSESADPETVAIRWRIQSRRLGPSFQATRTEITPAMSRPKGIKLNFQAPPWHM